MQPTRSNDSREHFLVDDLKSALPIDIPCAATCAPRRRSNASPALVWILVLWRLDRPAQARRWRGLWRLWRTWRIWWCRWYLWYLWRCRRCRNATALCSHQLQVQRDGNRRNRRRNRCFHSGFHNDLFSMHRMARMRRMRGCRGCHRSRGSLKSSRRTELKSSRVSRRTETLFSRLS